MALCVGYKIAEHTDDTPDDYPAMLCPQCNHRLSVDCRIPTLIMQDVETVALEKGDAVMHSDGTAAHFVRSETIDGSNYLRLYWDANGYAFDTTAEPWNTWSMVVRSTR